jgi:drug/metabolite transporter (DMT)-like permease
VTTTRSRRSSAVAAAAADRPVTVGVLAALGTVYLVWGSTYLAIKYTVTDLPPLLSMGARFVVASAVLLVVVLLLRGRRAFRVTGPQLRTAVLCGLLMLVGGNGVVAIAEQYVHSGLAALLIAATPLWVVVLRALLRDRPPAATVGGLVLGLVGVIVLLLPGLTGGGEGTHLGGLLLVCLSSLLWSIGTVLATRRPLPADPFATTVLEMAAAGGAMVLLGSLGGEWARLDLAGVGVPAWLALVYLVLVGSVVAYSAYVWLLARAPVSLVTTYAYVNPAVAVALGALFLSEPLTTTVLVGGAIIIAAVAVVITVESRRRSRRDADAPLEPA